MLMIITVTVLGTLNTNGRAAVGFAMFALPRYFPQYLNKQQQQPR
jgi:hypothetical protein